MSNVTLNAPAGLTGMVQTGYGNFNIEDGQVTVPAILVPNLLAAGFSTTPLVLRLPLLDAFCQDGAPIAAAAAAGDFGVSITPGTSFYLVGESTLNNTKTDKALWEVVLPASYVAGADIDVTVNAGWSGTGTVGTKTVDVNAYAQSLSGTQGADLCETAAQTLGLVGVYSDFTFTLDGAALAPGDTVLVIVTIALQETANMNALLPRLNSARID